MVIEAPVGQDTHTIHVSFEQPPGTIVDIRQFAKGQPLRITGGVSWAGLPVANPKMTLDIEPVSGGAFSPIYLSDVGSIFGNFRFDLTCPDVNARANAIITATYYTLPPFRSTESVTLPISFGNITPAPIPQPIDWKSVLKWVAIAGVAGAGIYLVAKFIPQRVRRAEQVKT